MCEKEHHNVRTMQSSGLKIVRIVMLKN